MFRAFLRHVLERVDWTTDLHFQTRTTIDTLDYSAGMGLNAGLESRGRRRRSEAAGRWPRHCPSDLRLPDGLPSRVSCCRACWSFAARERRFERDEAEYDPAIVALGRRPVGAGRFPARGRRGRQRVRGPIAGQLAVGDVHPVGPGERRLRGGCVQPPQALGLRRAAGDRRPAQAAPPAAARGGPGGQRSGSMHWRPGRAAARVI